MAVDDHGLEAIRKSAEEVVIGDKSNYYLKTTTINGVAYNFMEIMALVQVMGYAYLPIVIVTSITNNETDKRVEFDHNGFNQYYISYDTTRGNAFQVTENTLLLISDCTAWDLGDGDLMGT